MIAALGLISAFVLSLLGLIARGVLTDEIKGRLQQRTRAHLDATLDALPTAIRECWEGEWRAELAAKLDMPVTAWQLVCGIRRTAAELVAEPALAAAAQTHGAPQRRRLPITPMPQRAGAIRNKRVRALVSRVGAIVRVIEEAADDATGDDSVLSFVVGGFFLVGLVVVSVLTGVNGVIRDLVGGAVAGAVAGVIGVVADVDGDVGDVGGFVGLVVGVGVVLRCAIAIRKRL